MAEPRTSLALWEVEAEMARTSEAIQAATDAGEEPPEEALAEFARYAAMERTKADAVAAFLVQLKADAEQCEEYAARQRERADRLMAARKKLDRYVIACLQAAGKDKVRGVHFTLRVARSAERLVIEDEGELPLDLMKQPPPVPDGAAIKARLQAGEEVPGAWLARGEHLRVDQ